MVELCVPDGLNIERHRMANQMVTKLFEMLQELRRSDDGLMMGEEEVEEVAANAAIVFAATVMIPDHCTRKKFLSQCDQLAGLVEKIS